MYSEYLTSKNVLKVFKFLSSLYETSREYERVAADRLLERALSAVEADDQVRKVDIQQG